MSTGVDGIALPGEADYEAAAEVFNLYAPLRPAAALTARTVDQVRAAVARAAAEDMPVRMHSTGHASAAARPMDGALLIRTALDAPVDVDAAARTVRIPAGARWGAVADALAPHGLSVAHGSSPTVGAIGYLLGGGLSCYARTTGLAANAVRAVELVTADGQVRRADPVQDPELLWALRGGGGGFGVVTAMEIEAFPADSVITGALFWSARHAPRLLRAWRDWALDAPPAVTTSLRIMNLPDLPEVPPALRGGTVLGIDGTVLCIGGDLAAAQARARDLLGPLRAIAEPLLDTWQETNATAVLSTHMDPTDPVPILGDHMLLGGLDDVTIDRLLGLAGTGSGSPLVLVGLRQLGGALAVPDPRGGVLNHLDAAYAYSAAGVPESEADTALIVERCNAIRTVLAPWDTGRTAPTFVDNVHQPQGHLDDDQVRALDRVRDRVDPAGLFRGDIDPGATFRPVRQLSMIMQNGDR